MHRVKRTPRKLLLVTIVAAVVILAVSVYVHRESIGWTIWREYHFAPLATMFAGSDPTLFFAIGNYYYGEGAYDTQKAQTYFRAALTLDPNLQGPHYQLARIYFVQSDFSDALAEINTEIELHPEYGRSHYVRGLIYGYSGNLSAAETEFKAFLAWKPDSWAGNNDLAWILFQEGKYAEARDAALVGLKIDSQNPWLLNSLGVALLNTGDKKGAKDAFAKALTVLDSMTEADWGTAYPGNNPDIYDEGLSKMKSSIEENLQLLGIGDTGNPS